MAEGLLLYARHMDYPPETSPYKDQWHKWRIANGQDMALAVIKSQVSLFQAALDIGMRQGYKD